MDRSAALMHTIVVGSACLYYRDLSWPAGSMSISFPILSQHGSALGMQAFSIFW